MSKSGGYTTVGLVREVSSPKLCTNVTPANKQDRKTGLSDINPARQDTIGTTKLERNVMMHNIDKPAMETYPQGNMNW